ncbi:unnamed protein product [Chrysodeixis includens]|uniref:FLYWCH-type domain-containing protein n=1 Tax=Chrysodeixis includens TaxID=689277 RepID=A0A9N8Q148_CHRIL|nr:unnamed protein product [Chrysodeixis includens]
MVMSRRGKPLLSVQGYTFCKKNEYGYKVRWVCSTHRTKGCTAKVLTYNNEIIEIMNTHSH